MIVGFAITHLATAGNGGALESEYKSFSTAAEFSGRIGRMFTGWTCTWFLLVRAAQYGRRDAGIYPNAAQFWLARLVPVAVIFLFS